jgi:hypothetical protein
MRAHTLVFILLGDDPSSLEVLIERLVQQLQTTPPGEIATGSLRLPGQRRGSERAAPRPGAAAERALPSSSRSPRAREFLETFRLERSVREREQKVGV